MTPAGVLAFMRAHRLAVQSSLSSNATPQSAVVGIGITDRFEIVFDTLDTSRKARNLRANPSVAFVIGGTLEGDERTVQYEGVADEPAGADLDRLKQVYYHAYPDGPSRLSCPGLIYLRARPTWIRYSDFGQSPPIIVEFTAGQLTAPA